MTGGDLALVLTAAGGLATAGSTGFVLVLRELRAGRRATDAVGASVNGHLRAAAVAAYEARAAAAYQSLLVAALTAAGDPVPLDRSVLPPASPPADPTP